MRQFRIVRKYVNRFDVEMRVWYGWLCVKRFYADEVNSDASVEYAERLATELLDKLREEFE